MSTRNPQQRPSTPGRNAPPQAAPAPKRRLHERAIRVIIIEVLMIALIFANIYKLTTHSLNFANAEAAKDQWTYDGPLLAARGAILDRDGRELATSILSDTIVAAPPKFANDDINAVAAQLAPYLEMNPEDIIERLTSPKQQVNLKRLVEPEISKEIMKLEHPGLNVFKEPKRYYPLDTFASTILGISGTENNGLEGIEYYYNDQLSGMDGKLVKEIARSGQIIPDTPMQKDLPRDGYDIVLTIDYRMQHIAEQVVEECQRLNEAKSASAIIMDVHTGDILAMASYPDYDPNFYDIYPADLRTNKLVNDAFEPGSTFKLITAMGAIEEGLIHLDDYVEDPGVLFAGGSYFYNWDFGGHGMELFRDAMRNSCNVVLGQIGQMLGPERLLHYQEMMGFGQHTGIDFPGESTGILFDVDELGPTELVTAAFGQGPAVTPIQQITAIAAIANGGKLMQPMLVRELRNKDGTVVEDVSPTVVRNVASPETMETMRELMEYILNAPGSKGASAQYRLAGKTGTADKYNPETETYYGDRFISSTIGFAPADAPLYAIYLYVDEPSGPDGYFGGQVAAPYFRKIAEQLMINAHIPPMVQEESIPSTNVSTRDMPSLIDLTNEEADDVLLGYEVRVLKRGEGAQVLAQYPVAHAEVTDGQDVTLYFGDREKHDEGDIIVPDFSQKTMKEVTEVSEQMELTISYHGRTGSVYEQDPVAGTPIFKGKPITVHLR